MVRGTDQRQRSSSLLFPPPRAPRSVSDQFSGLLDCCARKYPMLVLYDLKEQWKQSLATFKSSLLDDKLFSCLI